MDQVMLTDAVMNLIRCANPGRSPCLVAIDGRCGAGKTTLAAALAEKLACPVVSMDHFFLRPHQRTPERLSMPGGNIDHERFLSEILRPMREGRAFTYRPFHCATGTLGDPVTVPRAELYIIEGSYACHPALREAYDLRIFLSVEPAEQLRRIEARNGSAMAAVFRDRWIPLEERYVDCCRVREACEAVFTT